MDFLKITEDKNEMTEIGRRIVETRDDIYTPLMLDKIMERIIHEFPDESPEVREQMLYSSVYDYWIYGNNIDEEFYYHFFEKSHDEKKKYMTNRVRTIYVDYLSCGSSRPDPALRRSRIDLLEMKYECYKKLRPYYKRDIIEINTEDDFDIFADFAAKHSEFVVKPSDFFYGEGVHKVSLSDFGSVKEAFDSILAEGKATKERHPSRKSSLVIEELIIQTKELAAIHPSSINGIRATAVRTRDGKIIIHHPWIKVGCGGQFVASAAFDGFDAEIDPETGVIISDGYSENGKVIVNHPDTGVKVKGYVIPEWDKLREFVQELMQQLPEYGYIGWDLVLTDNGWVVMEANYSGEFMWQLINGCGGREEFEEIIGWKMDGEFWWQVCPFPKQEKK